VMCRTVGGFLGWSCHVRAAKLCICTALSAVETRGRSAERCRAKQNNFTVRCNIMHEEGPALLKKITRKASIISGGPAVSAAQGRSHFCRSLPCYRPSRFYSPIS